MPYSPLNPEFGVRLRVGMGGNEVLSTDAALLTSDGQGPSPAVQQPPGMKTPLDQVCTASQHSTLAASLGTRARRPQIDEEVVGHL